MHKRQNRQDLLMIGAFVLTGCVITALLGVSLFYGNRMAATYAPLTNAAMEIKLQATSAHLWFEEIINGDQEESIDDVWRHLDTAEWYASAMLEGGQNATGTYRPLTDPLMRREIIQVKRKLERFRNITENRLKSSESSQSGTEIDQIYDRGYSDFIGQVDMVKSQLQLLMQQELGFFNRLSQIMIILVLLSVGMAGLLFHRYHRQQAQYRTRLAEANRKVNRSLNNLEEKVAERTRELARANSKLQELDRLKSMFVASMSHELQSPLTNIIDASRRVRREANGTLNAVQLDSLGQIEQSGGSLLSLVDEVIDISMIEAGLITANPSTFKLDELLNEAIESNRQQLEQKGLTLHSSFPDDLEIHTDRLRLYQCVINLLSNAIQFSESGEVRLSTRVDGPNLEIAVEDDGIGIEGSEMQRLFKPFERIHQVNGTQLPGQGLGLYLTKKLTAELLKGHVCAESQAGIGSRFTLRIPQQLEATA
jgi:signal transduction histidine kinase